MDPAFRQTLRRGAEILGLELSGAAVDLLERYADRLLAWNRKVNLTAITAPAEVAEKHVLDSLLVARSLGPARSLLDIGSGAGLPGVPLACVRPVGPCEQPVVTGLLEAIRAGRMHLAHTAR